MAEYKTIIIDDEEHAREVLKNLIEKSHKNFKILAEADSVSSGLKAINDHQPHLVLLDIHLGTKNAFYLLKKLPQINFSIIFITAYSQYAIEAIRFSALDYLLKPFSPRELHEALERFRKLRSPRQQDMAVQLSTLEKNIQRENGEIKIALPNRSGIVVKKLTDLIRCQGVKNYTIFYFKDGQQLVVSKNLGYFENQLAPYHFLRVFQSELINIREVANYIDGRGGVVTMSDGSQLKVSRDRKKILLQKLGGLLNMAG